MKQLAQRSQPATKSVRPLALRSTRPVSSSERPSLPPCAYQAVALGHPALRLKTLVVVEGGRRVLSTKPVIETTGELVAEVA